MLLNNVIFMTPETDAGISFHVTIENNGFIIWERNSILKQTKYCEAYGSKMESFAKLSSNSVGVLQSKAILNAIIKFINVGGVLEDVYDNYL